MRKIKLNENYSLIMGSLPLEYDSLHNFRLY